MVYRGGRHRNVQEADFVLHAAEISLDFILCSRNSWDFGEFWGISLAKDKTVQFPELTHC